MSSRLGRVGRPLLGVAVFVATLAAWEAWAQSKGSFYLPPVSEILEQAWQDWPTADFLGGVGASLRRLVLGYAIGVSLAIALGLVMGSSRRIRRILDPLTELSRALPVIALVPVAIVLFDVGDAMRVSLIAFGVFFPVLLATIDGVRAIPVEVRDTASLLRVGTVERTARIYFPAALPSIAAGLRVSASIGLVVVVISEFVGVGDGIGSYIYEQRTLFDVPAMYSGLLFLGLLGYCLNRLFVLAERQLLAWHDGAVGASER